MLKRAFLNFSILFILAGILYCLMSANLCHAYVSDNMRKQLEDSRMIFYVINMSESAGPIGLFSPSEGNKYAIIEVVIKNKMNDPLSFSALFAKLKDSLGYEHNIDAATTNIDFAFSGGKIAPKDIIRGCLVFQIPKNASASTLIYNDLFSEFHVNLIMSENQDPIPLSEYRPTAGVGDTVDDGRVSLTLNSFEEKKWIDIYRARSGWKFLIIDVTIKNLLDQQISYNPLYIEVKDSQGRMFGLHIATSSLEDGLSSGNLAQGETVRGKVAFEVPENESYFVIHYDDFISFIAAPIIPENSTIIMLALMISMTILMLIKRRKIEVLFHSVNNN